MMGLIQDAKIDRSTLSSSALKLHTKFRLIRDKVMLIAIIKQFFAFVFANRLWILFIMIIEHPDHVCAGTLRVVGTI